MSRWLRRTTALLAIAALTFAQLAVSAYSCPKDVADSAAAREDAGFADACAQLATPNLCERHCDYGSASVAPAPDVVAPPALVALPWGASPDVPVEAVSAPLERACAWAAPPPPPSRPLPLRI